MAFERLLGGSDITVNCEWKIEFECVYFVFLIQWKWNSSKEFVSNEKNKMPTSERSDAWYLPSSYFLQIALYNSFLHCTFIFCQLLYLLTNNLNSYSFGNDYCYCFCTTGFKMLHSREVTVLDYQLAHKFEIQMIPPRQSSYLKIIHFPKVSYKITKSAIGWKIRHGTTEIQYISISTSVWQN